MAASLAWRSSGTWSRVPPAELPKSGGVGKALVLPVVAQKKAKKVRKVTRRDGNPLLKTFPLKSMDLGRIWGRPWCLSSLRSSWKRTWSSWGNKGRCWRWRPGSTAITCCRSGRPRLSPLSSSSMVPDACLPYPSPASAQSWVVLTHLGTSSGKCGLKRSELRQRRSE